MSFPSTTFGTSHSPFLTSSLHHYHSNQTYPLSNHYNTNSYTNTPSYLQSYGKVSSNSNLSQKYFPKDFIKILPGISNLPTLDEQKIINPLNTYSGGNSLKYSGMHSPFNRGQIYYGNNDPMTSSLSTFTQTLIDQLGGDKFINKKENPFQKKYLLSQKNRQLQTYASYSTYQYKSQKNKYNQGNNKNKKYQRYQSELNQQEMGQGMLRLAKRYGAQNNNLQQNKKQRNISNSSDVNKNNRKYQNIAYQTVNKINNKYQDIIESQVDQKQFDSFGKGKQNEKQKKQKERQKNSSDSLKSLKNLRAQSFINDLTKMVKNDDYYQKDMNLRENPFDSKQNTYLSDYQTMYRNNNYNKQMGTYYQGDQGKNINKIEKENTINLRQNFEQNQKTNNYQVQKEYKYQRQRFYDNQKDKQNLQQREKFKDARKKSFKQEQQYQNFNKQSSKRQPFADSDDDEVRHSGTFKIPETITEIANIQRTSGNLTRKTKNSSNFYQQKNKYNKQQATQVGKQIIPPSRISFRGKTYQRILV